MIRFMRHEDSFVGALALLFSSANVMRLEEGITEMSTVQAKRMMLQVKQQQKEPSGGLNAWDTCKGSLWRVKTDAGAAFPPDPSAVILQ